MKLSHLGVVLALASTAACGKKAPAPGPTTTPPATTPTPPETKPPEAKPPEMGPPEAEADAAAPAPEADAAAEPAPADDAGAAAPAADEALIAQGKRIALVTGCPSCHTAFGPNGPDLAKAWAGGLEVPDAAGTWRSPNITPDKKTGIGGWSDAQIAAAIREGVRPDGSRLYAIMPYPCDRMTDADVAALVAYMRTLPAIENVVQGNADLKIPKSSCPSRPTRRWPTTRSTAASTSGPSCTAWPATRR